MVTHPLRVSENRRFLVGSDDKPFFYLGDTAWELFHRCTRADALHYLQDRAAKRFTVIQAVVLAEFGGLTEPNAQGDLPLHDNDPTQINEAYFSHVDFIVEEAAALGLTIGMLPTWGDKWNKQWGRGPEIFTPENARTYGQILGQRYRDKPLIWILGGDRPVETDTHRAVIENMARGLRAGDEGRHLISFHPMGGQTSAQHFHEADWLDFNMWQSGHDRNRDNYNCIQADYERQPIKPCMDAEPGYEDHAASFNLTNGYLDDYDVRKSAYWALFAGAHGHTYGCHPIWQMLQPGRNAVTWARRPWQEALHLPGSRQMQFARALLESRPFLTRLPDQTLISSEPGTGTDHVRATRDAEGSYAFVYVPSGKPVEIALERLSAKSLVASWYDPRTGLARSIGEMPGKGTHTFIPPSSGPDWVLVLDDTARRYPAPGGVL
ncbi:MAG TPA: glycoside hydrolase family 140 protein [Chthonomonadaceae bacterium]|nr:glycoside hydrolase family 140 protein [Chthonomonadaceae bacterium]